MLRIDFHVATFSNLLTRAFCIGVFLYAFALSGALVAQSGVKLSNPILTGPGNQNAAPSGLPDSTPPQIQPGQNSRLEQPRSDTPVSRDRVFPNNKTSTPPVTSPQTGNNSGLLRGMSSPMKTAPTNQSFHGQNPQTIPPSAYQNPPAIQNQQRSGNSAPVVQPSVNRGIGLPQNPYGRTNFGPRNNGPGFQIPRPTLQTPFGSNPRLNRGLFRNQPVQGQSGYGNQPNQPNLIPNQPIDENLPEGVEVIRERYNNGAVRIERQVILDQNQNYINHGQWRYYLPNGRVAAQAYFENGSKSGVWSRWLTIKDAPLLRQLPFNQFQAPFLNTFSFQNDSLNGKWKLQDSAKRIIFEIDLHENKRNGVCTWYFVNGQEFQELGYSHGKLHGTFRKWNGQGKLIEDRKFVEGREVGKITEFHRQGVKKLEYGILAGEVESLTLDNPWNLEFATEKKIGPDIKNGEVTAWYPNGQIQFTGQFRDDVQEGSFVWYYETGQKQAEGKFNNDQRADVWVWWHENGMRASAGRYVAGLPAGNWQWWLADGKLSRSKEFERDPTLVNQPEQMKNASFRNGDK